MRRVRWDGGRAARAALVTIACLTLPWAACGSPDRFVVQPVEFAGPPGSMAPNLAVDGDRAILSWLEPTGGERYAMRVAVRDAETWRVVGTPVENDSLFVNWADFPSVTPLADGRWVAHWLQKTAPATYAYHVHLSVSTDDGVTWSDPFVPHGDRSPTEHGFVAMVPWADGAMLVWLDGRKTGGARGAAGAAGAGHDGGGPLTLRATTLDGATVPAPDVEVDGRVCDCCQTDLARTASGLVAVYRDRTEAEIRDIAVTRFADGAWSAPATVADDNWHYPGCPVNGPAVAANGDRVVVAWFTGAGDTSRTFAAVSSDGGASFGERLRIDEGLGAGRTDVQFLDDDTAVVSWLENLPDGGAEIRLRTVGVDGHLGKAYTIAGTTSARAAGFPRLARRADRVLAAWTDPLADRVRVASIRDGR